MIRIMNEAFPGVIFTSQELLAQIYAGATLTVFEGLRGEGLNVKAHDLGNGHLELSASSPTVWVERDGWNRVVIETYLENAIAREEEEAEERRERSLTIAANRAKTKVRKLCKLIAADTLLTLTYQHCEADLQRSKRDLKEFVRRLRRLLPGFSCVAVYEYQKRGALHWHIATAGRPTRFEKKAADGSTYHVKSFDALRAVWRSVVGERGGNVDLSRRKAHSQRSPARIATYISKYIVKAFKEGQAFTNRYTCFGKFDMPAPVSLGHFPTALAAIEACYALVGDGQTIVLSHLSRWRDWFVLHVEAKRARPG